jgi:hypothetical protein
MHMQAAVGVGKMGQQLIACVKTAHAGYPKEWLLSTLTPLPAGSRAVLTSTVNGQDLVAVGYKYNRRKVLFFVTTKGAGVTTNGAPYLQRFPDSHGNLVIREVPRPDVISKYFAASPRVDNHNQSRQDDLGLEELWQTQDCWFRLHCTVQGMCATDCWKAARYHLAPQHPLKIATMGAFADRLAAALIKNNLDGVPAPTRVSNRKRPLDDITNAVQSGEEPHPIGHFDVVKVGSKRLKQKQLRCRWCILMEGRTSYTTYFCRACNIALCSSLSAHQRTCWAEHAQCSAAELAQLLWRKP